MTYDLSVFATDIVRPKTTQKITPQPEKKAEVVKFKDALEKVRHEATPAKVSQTPPDAPNKTKPTPNNDGPHPALSNSAPDESNMIKLNVDLNDDGTVDTSDLLELLANFGTDDAEYDLNKDGVNDSKDLDLLTAFWGHEGDVKVSSPDINQDGIVDSDDLMNMLANFGTDDSAYDLNGDGVNNQQDLDVLMAFWGQSRYV